MFGTHLKLYRQSADREANYQFILDSLASKEPSNNTSLDLRVNSFIMRHCSVTYDQLDAATTKGKLNPKHLNIDGISCHIILKALNKDSLNVNIKKIAFKEQSGMKLDKLSLRLEAGKNFCKLNEFSLEMPNTHIVLNKASASYKSKGYKPILATLKYSGMIGESKISPSDFAWLAPPLENIGRTVLLTAKFSGTRYRHSSPSNGNQDHRQYNSSKFRRMDKAKCKISAVVCKHQQHDDFRKDHF